MTEAVSNVDPEILSLAKEIMVLQRASEGKTPEPQDVISNLVNVRNMLERTGFPTFMQLQFCTYLKTQAKILNRQYGTEEDPKPAESLEWWADNLMAALIAYKRQQRKEAIEMVKKATSGDETTFHFATAAQQPVKAPRFQRFRRKPKEAESEFTEA